MEEQIKEDETSKDENEMEVALVVLWPNNRGEEKDEEKKRRR